MFKAVTNFFSTTTTSASRNYHEEIQQIVKSKQVAIFSKTWCGYCSRAKRTIDSYGVSMEVKELDKLPDENEWQQALQEMTGQRTVPSVWIGGKFVGGSDELERLHRDGRLKLMLEEGSDAGKL